MGLFLKRQEPVEAIRYGGSKTSAAPIIEAYPGSAAWDRGALYVSTHEGQRRLGRGDVVIRTERGPIVMDGPDFVAGYYEVVEPAPDDTPAAPDDLRIAATEAIAAAAAEGRTPLVQISMETALLLDVDVCNPDARAALRDAISERLTPVPDDATTATDDGPKVIIVGEPE